MSVRSVGPNLRRRSAAERQPRLRLRIAGSGPAILLVHGTASTGQSWSRVMGRLADHFTLLAPDLPGHGESEHPQPGRYSPRAMASALAGLLEQHGRERSLNLRPQLVVGHSAGAAVLASGLASGLLDAKAFVAINPAMLPFPGLQGLVMPGLARTLARAPLIADWVALQGRDRLAVRKLLQGIGTQPDDAQVADYQRLFGDPAHVRAVLRMMAEWNLPAVAAALPRLALPTLLVGGLEDRAVPRQHLAELCSRMPQAERILLGGVGHLAPEEAPDRIAELIHDWFARHLSVDDPWR